MPRYLAYRSLSVLAACLFAFITTSPAFACGGEVRVTYHEASPDVFVIDYPKGQFGHITSVSIDLSTSRGQAYVDTPYGPAGPTGGSGVEFGALTGFASGSQTGTVTFKSFPPGHRFTMLIDLDDLAVGGDRNQNVLVSNEIEGGKVAVRIRDAGGQVRTLTGEFDAKGVAYVGNRACA